MTFPVVQCKYFLPTWSVLFVLYFPCGIRLSTRHVSVICRLSVCVSIHHLRVICLSACVAPTNYSTTERREQMGSPTAHPDVLAAPLLHSRILCSVVGDTERSESNTGRFLGGYVHQVLYSATESLFAVPPASPEGPGGPPCTQHLCRAGGRGLSWLTSSELRPPALCLPAPHLPPPQPHPQLRLM